MATNMPPLPPAGSGDASTRKPATTGTPKRPAMRHDCPIPGPVRWIERRSMEARSCMGGIALSVVSTRDDGDMLYVLMGDGFTRFVRPTQACFPINGPANEPPQWAPEVAVLGPVPS